MPISLITLIIVCVALAIAVKLDDLAANKLEKRQVVYLEVREKGVPIRPSIVLEIVIVLPDPGSKVSPNSCKGGILT